MRTALRVVRRVAALGLLALGAASGLAAQGGLTPEQAVAVKSIGGIRISPDGKWVAYTVTTPDLAASSQQTDIWLVATSGGDPVRLTTAKESDNGTAWSPDGRTIAFLSARGGKPQLYRISPFGGEAVLLTDSKTAIQSFAWAPDGRRIAYVAERDPTPAEEKKAKDHDDAIVVDENFIPARLYLFDLDTKKATELVGGDTQIGSPAWSPDGTKIAYVTVPTPRADDGRYADVMVVEVTGGAPRKVLGSPGAKTSPSWSPDSRTIALLVTGPDAPRLHQARLALVPAAGGAARFVATDFEYEPGHVAWSADGATLRFWSPTRTTVELYSTPAVGGPVRKVSALDGSLGLFGGGGAPSISADGATIAYGRSTIGSPDEVHVSSLRGPWRNTRLTFTNPQLADVPMGRSEVVRWKSKDGLEVEGIVVYPVGYQPGRRYPTVAIIHGGPSGVWDQSFAANWYNPAQVYAGHGWVSFLPNPRGSSGYGEKFLAANLRDWGNGDYQDIQSGLDYLVTRGIADPDRMAQGGWSYGGFMTAWTLTQTDRFKAVMVGAGLTNLYSMYSTNDLQMVLEDYFGGQPWDDEAAFRRASAMTFIKQAKTPTLILHGQQDTRVPIGQAQELYMGLRKNGVPVELVFYPREPHGLMEPQHALDKIAREYAFFSKYVLGVEVNRKPAPVP